MATRIIFARVPSTIHCAPPAPRYYISENYFEPGRKKKKIHQPAVYTAVINTLLMPVDSKIGKENLFSPRPSDCPITDNIYNRVNVDNHLSISTDFFVYHFGFFFDKAENQRLV